ncbi:DUF5017 domain-containing protein [Pedobacter sp. UYP1]|uniref:DUF5017 domain-containing protein n=1 Tax=Pedobacter sp. UYP1 TaxID=1756396 RepID=UPI003396437B
MITRTELMISEIYSSMNFKAQIMRKTFVFFIAALTLAAASCSKKDEVKPVSSFTVQATTRNGSSGTSFALGDTTNFAFTGNPDIITFYSGEPGKNYEYRTRVKAAGIPQLKFSNLRAGGPQAGSLSLLVSSDFKSVVLRTAAGVQVRDTSATNANIAGATWTDITSRALLSTGAAAAVASGTIDLSDFSKDGKPVYIAFKYLAVAGTIQNKWTISALTLNNVLADGSTYTNASLNGPTKAISNYGNSTYGPGWAVSYDPSKNLNKLGWVYTDGTSLVITGAATAAAATAPAEAWAIMGPIDLSRVTPDAGLAIKNISATLSSYQYKYTAAGSYNSVFVAANSTADESATKETTVQIIVK